MIFEMVLIAFISVSIVMTTLWLIQLKTKNAGIVDIGWSANFTLITLIYFLVAEGYLIRKILITAMVAFWSLRLALYLFVRVTGEEEDGRYQSLRQQWGANIAVKFLLFFLFQGVLNLVLSIPFLAAAVNQESQILGFEYLGVAIWLIAIIGESAADRQLQKFKSEPSNKGQVCQVGLWKYSRHPNYFFEWLIWIAFFVFALASPYGYISIICPLMMLYFLFKVTGIPLTEEQSIRSKGDAYREYQQTTSAFFPWWRREIPKKQGDENNASQLRSGQGNRRTT